MVNCLRLNRPASRLGLKQRLYEVRGVQFLSGGPKYGGTPVIAGAEAEEGLLKIAAGELVLIERPLDYVLLDVAA